MRIRTLAVIASIAAVSMLLAPEVSAKSILVTSAEKPGKDVGKPGPDEARIVFVRPSNWGYAIAATVHERHDDGSVEMVTTLYGENYMVHSVSPGKHVFAVVSEAADFIEINAKAGKIYSVVVLPRMGAWKARFSMLPATPGTEHGAKLEEYLGKSRKVVPNELAPKWFNDNKASVLEKCNAYWPKWIEKKDKPVIAEDAGVDEL